MPKRLPCGVIFFKPFSKAKLAADRENTFNPADPPRLVSRDINGSPTGVTDNTLIARKNPLMHFTMLVNIKDLIHL